MQRVQAAPVARRLIDGLRDLGYEFETAVADLVDNSLEADATEIHVDIVPRKGNVPAHVTIADNGCGIERESLVDVMRLGVLEDHSPDDLGKYGLGLKTASLSQADVLTVSSRAESAGGRGKRHVARWDLNTLGVKWDLQLLDNTDLREWEAKALDPKVAREHGTVVLWSNLDQSLLLDADNDRTREDALADLTIKVKRHIRMVFHRFLEHSIPRRRKVEIRVGGDPLAPSDPFCRSESTKELKVKTFKIQISENKTGILTVAPYVLPAEKEFSSSDAHAEAGWGNWNQRQGLYFYRNNRLIQAGGWSWLRTPDEHTKLLRIAVDFSGELDKAVGVNVSKMRARIPAAIRDQVRNSVSEWAREARQRYDTGKTDATTRRRGRRSSNVTAAKEITTRPFGALVVTRSESEHQHPAAEVDEGRVEIVLPPTHPAFESSELKAFTAALIELLACVAERQVAPRDLPIKSLRRKWNELL